MLDSIDRPPSAGRNRDADGDGDTHRDNDSQRAPQVKRNNALSWYDARVVTRVRARGRFAVDEPKDSLEPWAPVIRLAGGIN